MRNGLANEPIIANIIENKFAGSISIEDGMLRAIKRDLWHLGIALGPNFLKLYLKIHFIRCVYDYLRIIKFVATAQIFTSGIEKGKSNLFFIHHKKYNELISDNKNPASVHFLLSKKNIHFFDAIKKIVPFKKNKDYKFMHFVNLWISEKFQDYKEFKVLNIFEGDTPLTALVTFWARKNNLYVKLYQWGHANPGKSLIAFKDIGVDCILCSSKITAEKLAECNPGSKIEMFSPPYLDAKIKKVLFIDQGWSKHFGIKIQTDFLKLASTLAQEGFHVDLKLHPNTVLKKRYMKELKGIGVISGPNLAENYLRNYDAVVGIESSVLVTSCELGIKTISFNPKLFDKNTFVNQEIAQIETYEALKTNLGLNCH